MRQPAVLARQETHDWVMDALSKEKRGALLDAPAGAGALALRLKEMGFSVACYDINPSVFSVPGIEIKQGDLNQRLPFEAGSFDFVTCLEGLEHLENPFNAVREFCRLLKPGGKLILSFPNYLNIERRLRFLITGLFSKVPLSQEAREGAIRAIMDAPSLPPELPHCKTDLGTFRVHHPPDRQGQGEETNEGVSPRGLDDPALLFLLAPGEEGRLSPG